MDVACIFGSEGCGVNVSGQCGGDGVIRGAWLVVVDGLAAWSLAFLVRGTICKPMQVHLLLQITMVQAR